MSEDRKIEQFAREIDEKIVRVHERIDNITTVMMERNEDIGYIKGKIEDIPTLPEIKKELCEKNHAGLLKSLTTKDMIKIVALVIALLAGGGAVSTNLMKAILGNDAVEDTDNGTTGKRNHKQETDTANE